jgi:hypothetical protein
MHLSVWATPASLSRSISPAMNNTLLKQGFNVNIALKRDPADLTVDLSASMETKIADGELEAKRNAVTIADQPGLIRGFAAFH